MQVLPQRKVLDGNGYVWEYELAIRGWNELSDEQKLLKLVDGIGEPWILRSDALDVEILAFSDEVEQPLRNPKS